MQERFAVGLSLLCAAAVLASALYARWDFPTSLIATLAAMLGGMLAGRMLGAVGARVAQQNAAAGTGPEPDKAEPKEALEPEQRTS
jgi:hypothetical protein